MTGIDSFFGKRNNVQQTVYDKKENLNKEEQRQLEMETLQPDGLQSYAGDKPIVDKFTETSVLLIFKEEEDLELFERHFYVSRYVQNSVTDIRPILALVREMEKGNIKYDKKKDKIKYRPRKD